MNDRPTAHPSGWSLWLFAGLHLLCCGLPLLILSGISMATLWDRWPYLAGVLAAVGVVGFVWYLKRGCATCPRNEGRCERPPNLLRR